MKFNLSEKELKLESIPFRVFARTDIKEFIQRLKRDFDEFFGYDYKEIDEIIDNRAGKELTDNHSPLGIGRGKAQSEHNKTPTDNHTSPRPHSRGDGTEDKEPGEISAETSGSDDQGCGNERPQRKTFCQLFKGHEGSHQAVIYWEDEDGSDDVCECGELSDNHLAKDGHRTRNGIYCPDNSGKEFKPKEEK